jgi:carboxypeptidase C (cathepsin A)
MRNAKFIFLAALLGLAMSPAVTAQSSSVTRHFIRIANKPLEYSAEAGFVPLTDYQSGVTHGRIFYTAYLIDGPARPVTFMWNGGPGAPSTWVQFQGFGPRLLKGADFFDNQDTPLPVTDIVFVDPIGTGYSRPEKTEYAPEYFSTVGDASSITQFILAWLKEHRAETRPIFLMGESFGGYRAGGVTERLESKGRRVAGVILISGGSASGPLIPRDVRSALVTPQRAAAALVLGKTAPDLGTDRVAIVRAATQWSLETYLPALVHADKLTDAERDAIVKDLNRFTGYPAEKIDRKTLLIGHDYLKIMSPDPDKPLSPFDMRTTDITPFNDAALQHYLRDELGVRTDLKYWGENAPNDPMHAGGKHWVYNYRWPESEKWGQNYAEPWLPKAIEIDPKIKVWVAAGQYDSLNSCAENDVLRSMLEPDLAPNYTMRCYLGGHMVYRDDNARVALSNDLKAFIADRVREP